ncbi:hypothetical protein MRB53_004507 [Persea americana]|uniref:Uncharacterized protein n=1 Tax=Persea americana TaxID=3435 RepID=A0ACC2MAM4_PERAE|nr:hypothetical protein MRB53_004507 [Persea americana]
MLEACDLFENAVRVGEQTVLFLPSFESCPKLKEVSTPIVFNVIERTKLASLSEGVVIGTSYVVTPTCPGMEDASDYYDKSQVNLQLYHGLCEALYSLDEGLICYSNCNTQTMLETTFQCFYILQPSEHGPMFLKRLAGKEEILPIPEGIQSNDALLPKDIGNSIQTALSNLELREYNPLLHERGLHSKLNWLVKESLHFGSISWPNRAETISKEPTPNSLNPTVLQASTKPSPAEKETMAEEKTQPKEPTPNSLNPPLLQASKQPPPAVKEDMAEEKTQPNLPAEEDMAAAACISQEWEELIITEVGKSFSPTCVSKPTFKNLVSSLPDNKPLDEKTFRILERLEAPKKQKIKETSPVLAVNHVTGNASGPMKKPLVPFGPSNLTDHHLSLSQPIKPSFQRMKRKLR